MLKLDFSIQSSSDRADYVKKFMDDSATYSKKELETISNYILYGKDPDGTSSVDRKEIQIKPKHNSFTNKKIESLDALLENPNFKEEQLALSSTRYRNPKPSIDHEKLSDAPGMKELWEAIKVMEEAYEKSKLTSNITQTYELQHALIELRRQQYTLKDFYSPVICRYKTSVKPSYYEIDEFSPWDELNSNYAIAPLGLFSSNPTRFLDPRSLEEKDYHYNEKAKYILDFRNPTHIYQLYENRLELETEAEKNPEYLPAEILKTLDFYEKRANLTDKQKRLLFLKIHKYSNAEIANKLNQEFGANHNENYISTLYKKKICRRIADACVAHFEEYYNREIATAWKKCSCCGEWKLINTTNFVKRKKSSDGFASICKNCDKKRRGERK